MKKDKHLIQILIHSFNHQWAAVTMKYYVLRAQNFGEIYNAWVACSLSLEANMCKSKYDAWYDVWYDHYYSRNMQERL